MKDKKPRVGYVDFDYVSDRVRASLFFRDEQNNVVEKKFRGKLKDADKIFQKFKGDK